MTLFDQSDRSFLDQALKIYGDHEHFINEKARAKFRRAKLLGLMQRMEDSNLDMQYAIRLYRQIRPFSSKGRGVGAADQFTDADFDAVVMFWSR